ncbi:MAG: hypothetical protein HRU36_01835 [Rickettsiales bacterium]|nr:hypothetical protein [Rickettsiales bacterium]
MSYFYTEQKGYSNKHPTSPQSFPYQDIPDEIDWNKLLRSKWSNFTKLQKSLYEEFNDEIAFYTVRPHIYDDTTIEGIQKEIMTSYYRTSQEYHTQKQSVETHLNEVCQQHFSLSFSNMNEHDQNIIGNVILGLEALGINFS